MASRRQVGVRVEFLGVTRGISCAEILYLLKCKIIRNPKVSCQIVYPYLFMLLLGRPLTTQVEIKMLIMPLTNLVIIQEMIQFLNNHLKIVQNSGSPEGVM